MKDVILDALLDSLKLLAVVIVIYILLSFIEDKIAKSKKISKENKLAPLIGASTGIIPQCGMSVIAADMYISSHITMGTVIAAFVACSDEALPILLSKVSSTKDVLMLLLVLVVKIISGFVVGFMVDLFVSKKEQEEQHLDEYNSCDEHIGCCHHHIEDGHEKWLHKHIIHPLLHSMKIFLYVFAVNLIFGFVVYFIGENVISNFLITNKYIAPIFSMLVGIIPNCASSVIITELYLSKGIAFGAMISGLIMNAGLGMVVLIKKKSMWKQTLTIFLVMILTSLVVGYALCFIMGF